MEFRNLVREVSGPILESKLFEIAILLLEEGRSPLVGPAVVIRISEHAVLQERPHPVHRLFP